MRMIMIAAFMLPTVTFAQTVETTPPACGQGLVWDSEAVACVAAETTMTPMEQLPARSNCSGAPRQVTS